MPQNLDEDTRRVILTNSVVINTSLAVFNLYVQNGILPRVKSRIKPGQQPQGPMLLGGCLKALAIMGILSYLATAMLITMGDKPVELVDNTGGLSSSINFCEEDFVDSRIVAEPANAMSSLTTYCPLALVGLFGPPSTLYSDRTKGSNQRFSLAYISILAIGLGSVWLHSALTASAQGGDELPMLWYVGIIAFIAMDSILDIRKQKQSPKSNWLVHFCSLSSIVATLTYVFNRDHWIIFYSMFSIYCAMILIGVATLSFSDLSRYGDSDAFRGNIMLPLMSCTLWVYIVASSIWLSEMVFCHDVIIEQRWGDTIAPWIWNRAVHPAWHCTSGLLAFLVVQILTAVRGFQLGWGEPRLEWFVAPYVTFDKAGVD